VNSRWFLAAVIASGMMVAACSRGAKTPTPTPTRTPTPVSTPIAGPTPTPTPTGPSSKSSVAYHPKTVTPQVSGTTVSLSAEEVGRNGIENFSVSSPAGNMTFMAYQLDGKYYVRAAICVPCGGKSFTLQNGTLTCDTCGTVFNATTGIGLRGSPACVTYAKKAAAYTTDGGNIAINMNDLTTAYQDTLNRK